MAHYEDDLGFFESFDDPVDKAIHGESDPSQPMQNPRIVVHRLGQRNGEADRVPNYYDKIVTPPALVSRTRFPNSSPANGSGVGDNPGHEKAKAKESKSKIFKSRGAIAIGVVALLGVSSAAYAQRDPIIERIKAFSSDGEVVDPVSALPIEFTAVPADLIPADCTSEVASIRYDGRVITKIPMATMDVADPNKPVPVTTYLQQTVKTGSDMSVGLCPVISPESRTAEILVTRSGSEYVINRAALAMSFIALDKAGCENPNTVKVGQDDYICIPQTVGGWYLDNSAARKADPSIEDVQITEATITQYQPSKDGVALKTAIFDTPDSPAQKAYAAHASAAAQALPISLAQNVKYSDSIQGVLDDKVAPLVLEVIKIQDPSVTIEDISYNPETTYAPMYDAFIAANPKIAEALGNNAFVSRNTLPVVGKNIFTAVTPAEGEN